MAFWSRSKRLGAAAALLLLNAGCAAEYWNNWDTVSARAGNAPEANTAIQTIQPWPPGAYDTDIDVSQ
ncbi:hypothetical protein [Litorisediminicola beolgyonensis]|uniref:Uncharacterized protein n=1 Tax=Litorisediminicola beolgyonensis TaxID=1173614 RepID=A0ABW3ZES5_9RHOB